MEGAMTETEQEHAQLIDFQQERMNRIEAQLEETRSMVATLFGMLDAYFKSQNIEFEEHDE
jgi:uncharacterized membrane protein